MAQVYNIVFFIVMCVPYIPSFFRTAIMEGCFTLKKNVLYIYWDDCAISVKSIYMLHYNDLGRLNHPCILWMKTASSWYIIIFSMHFKIWFARVYWGILSLHSSGNWYTVFFLFCPYLILVSKVMLVPQNVCDNNHSFSIL